MRKTIILIMTFIFLLFGCDSGPNLEYDEEVVKKDALEYLKEKYGGDYEFSSSSSPGGSNFVNISFKDLNESDDKGSRFVVLTWYEESGIASDYTKYIENSMEFDEELLKKEALEYLESKYDDEFDYMWCIGHYDYVDIVFDVPNSQKPKKVSVTWKEDGTMTDNYEE